MESQSCMHTICQASCQPLRSPLDQVTYNVSKQLVGIERWKFPPLKPLPLVQHLVCGLDARPDYSTSQGSVLACVDF